MFRFLRAFTVLVACFSIGSHVSPAFADDEKPAAKGDLGGDASPKDSSAKKDNAGSEDGGKKNPEEVSGGRFAGDPIYVHIAPMVMPIITDSGVEQLVTIVIDIQVKDFDTADVLHSNMPRVMDALMRSLYGGLGEGNLRNGKLVDITKIKSKAAHALSDLFTGDAIKDVLIQGVAQRML